MTDLIEPPIQPSLIPLDFVDTLAHVYRRTHNCPQFEKSKVFLEQCAVFRALPDPKLFRRSLRSMRLRYERREDELVGLSSMDCCGRNLECPKATLVPGYDPESVYDLCMCSRNCGSSRFPCDNEVEECSTSSSEEEEDGDMSFCIGENEIRCRRFNMASLSRPFKTMLFL